MLIPAKLDTGEEARIGSIVQTQRQIYQERVRVQKHIRRVRALRIDTRTPRTFQRLVGRGVRNPLPWSLVQTIVGMIAKGAPQFHRVPLQAKDREQAAKLAASCWPLLQTYSRMARKDIPYQIIDQLAGDGMSVVKLQRVQLTDYPVQDFEAGENLDDYKKRVAQYEIQPGHNPLRLLICDPAVFYPEWADEPSYVVETGRKALLPMLKALNMRMGTNNKLIHAGPMISEDMQPLGIGMTEEVTEVWSDEFVYFIIGGNTYKFENEFGFIPYAWRSGMTTSIPDPTLQAVSTVFPFFATDPYINTLLTSLLSWAIMSGMPTAVVETVPTSGALPGEQTPPTDLPLGQMVELQVGKTFKYATPPPIGNTVIEAVNLFLSFYDRAGVTSAARGIIGTRTPGLTFTSAIEAAADMVSPIQASAEGMFEDIVAMTWKAVDKFDLNLQVTGRELVESGKKKVSVHQINKRLLKGYFDIHCTLQPMSDQQMVQRGMHAAFMRDKQLWSTERSMSYGGVEDTEAERREILLDRIRQTPAYQRAVMMGALSDDPAQVEAIQQAAQQGQDLLGLEDFSQNVLPQGDNPSGQIRGETRRGGGREAGSPRRPTGPRPVAQGQQFPS